MGAEAVIEAETKLSLAENMTIEGKAKIEIELYGEAFNLANKAIRTAQEARFLVEAENRLNLKFKLRIRGDSASEVKKEDASKDESILKAETRSETRDSERSNEEAEIRSKTEIEGGENEIKGDVKLKIDF